MGTTVRRNSPAPALMALLLAALATSIHSQPPSQHAGELIDRAWSAVKSGEPARQWANRLWDYRQAHPNTPVAARAASEALRLLAFAGEYTDLMAKATLLPPDDPAWIPVLNVLLETARATNNYYFLVTRAKRLADSSAAPEIQRQAEWALGQAYLAQNQTEKAKQAFQKVIKRSPETDLAKSAESSLREMEVLKVGQPAPDFQATTIQGQTIQLSALKGRVVLIDFWATWCAPCEKERPLIRSAFEKYRDRNFTVIGISLDEEPAAVKNLLDRERDITWPQIVDGPQGPLVNLFHITSIPANYLIETSGKIASKRIPAPSLNQAIEQALRSGANE
jgi:peroxiredoxin